MVPAMVLTCMYNWLCKQLKYLSEPVDWDINKDDEVWSEHLALHLREAVIISAFHYLDCISCKPIALWEGKQGERR